MTRTPCAVPSCKNNNTKNKELSFFHITVKRKPWVKVLGNKALLSKTDKQLASIAVCAVHFRDQDFRSVRRTSLNDNAVPSLHLPIDELDEAADDVAPISSLTIAAPVFPLQMSASRSPVPPVDGVAVDAIELGVEVLESTPDNSHPALSYTGGHDMMKEHGYFKISKPDGDSIMQNSELSKPDGDVVMEEHGYFAPPWAHVDEIGKDALSLTKTLNVQIGECLIDKTAESVQFVRQKISKKQRFNIPRIPRSQKSQLVSDLQSSAKLWKARAKNLERKYIQKCNELREIKKDKENKALETLQPKLDRRFFMILQCQVRNADRAPQGRRYFMNEKVLFTGMKKKSSKLYGCLPFIKPTRKTVTATLKKLNFTPGINPAIMASLKERVAAMDDDNKDVIIIFDEMSLKIFFVYDPVLDVVVGWVDLGNGRRRRLEAQEALNCMIRSVHGKWKQPIAFWFTHQKFTGVDFKMIFTEAIEAVLDTGLRVRGIVIDGLGKNKTAVLLMGASLSQPWFFLKEKKIYVFFDPPHIWKCLRNALLRYILMLPPDGKDIVKKEYMDLFIEMDMKVQPRLAKKITSSHLRPSTFQRMNVPLARQLFSGPMAAGIMTYTFLNALPAEAMVTGRWVERIDQIIDSENGVTLIPNEDHPFKCAITLENEETMLKLWNDHIQELEGWYFPRSRGITFISNWIITTRSRICLWEDLKREGATSMPTGHINSDSIENFHFQARDVHLTPHAAAYPSSFSTALINTLTSSGKGKNCRDDNALNLINLETLMKYAEESPASGNSNLFDALPCVDPEEEEEQVLEDFIYEEEEEEPEAGGQEVQIPSILTTDDFVSRVQQKLTVSAASKAAGPVVEEFLKKVPCTDCKQLLLTAPQFPLHLPQMMLSAPSNLETSTLQPSRQISEVTRIIYSEAKDKFSHDTSQPNILKNFTEYILGLPDLQMELCINHQDLIPSFINRISRQALQDMLLFINQEYKAKNKEERAKKQAAKAKRVMHQ